MTVPRDWWSSTSAASPASSWGFRAASEIARANHPTARAARADLLARVLPFADEPEVGASADRRRHDDRSRPTAAAVGAASSTPAGARRGLIALATALAVGVWIGLVVGRPRANSDGGVG